MKLEHLYYLVQLSEWKSMNVASENLPITQQALSLAVKSLEDEFLVKLVERSRQGITLTAEGEKVVKLAQEVLSGIDQLKAEFQSQLPNKSSPTKLNGVIHCIINAGLNLTIFPRLVTTFYKSYPGIQFKVEECTAKEIVQKIARHEGDLGLLNRLTIDRKTYGVDLEPNVKFVPFFNYTLHALINKASPLAKYKTLSITTLLKEPFVLCAEKETVDEYLLTQLLKYYGAPQIIVANSAYVAKQMVIDNLAVSITLAYDPIVIDGMDKVVSIPLNNKFFMQTGYLYATTKPLSPAALAFIEKLDHLPRH